MKTSKHHPQYWSGTEGQVKVSLSYSRTQNEKRYWTAMKQLSDLLRDMNVKYLQYSQTIATVSSEKYSQTISLN